jgi:hypothetical protein
MKNFEGKKQGLVTRFKAALFGKEPEYKRDLRMASQDAQILCERWSSWGVKARIMGEQGTTVIIEIADNPINRVHVSHYFSANADIGLQSIYHRYFIVTDSRHLPKLEIVAFPVRSRRYGWIKVVYGKLVDIHWKGNDCGTGISRDPEIKEAIMGLINEQGKPFQDDTQIGFMRIQTRLDPGSWVIGPESIAFSFKQQHWRRYESIAARLLALAIPKQDL